MSTGSRPASSNNAQEAASPSTPTQAQQRVSLHFPKVRGSQGLRGFRSRADLDLSIKERWNVPSKAMKQLWTATCGYRRPIRRRGRYRDAYQVLKKALEASGGNNLAIRERLEDAQIPIMRTRVAIAERGDSEPTEEAHDLVKRFSAELNRQELLVLSHRADRSPQDLHAQLELGIRLKRDGNYQQARQAFNAARAAPDLRTVATLGMGEAFQHLQSNISVTP